MSWGALLLDLEQNLYGPVGALLLSRLDVNRVGGSVVLTVEEEEYPHQLVASRIARLQKGGVRLGGSQHGRVVRYGALVSVVVVVEDLISGRSISGHDVVQSVPQNTRVRLARTHWFHPLE